MPVRSLCLVLAVLPVLASADRLILAPTGNKIRFGQARLESMFTPDGDQNRWFLGYGVTKEIELEVTSERFRSGVYRNSLNASFNLMNPLTDFAPGVSFGVTDALDNTADGRRTYLAVTFRLGLDGDYNQDAPMEATVGFAYGRGFSPFVGVMIPLTWQTRLLAEHDGFRVSAGLEFRPLRGLAARYLQVDGKPTWSLSLTAKF